MKSCRPRLLLLALLSGVVGDALGAACLSNLGGGTGNWNVAATWTSCNGVTPQAADTVQIRGGDTVTMNTTATVSSLLVGSTAGNNTSTLTFAAGSSLTVGGTITMSGNNGNRHGVINMAAGGTLVANGSPAFAFGSGTETWTPGTGTVQLGSTNTLPWAAGVLSTFNNLVIAANTTTLGGATTVTGNLTVNGVLAGATTISLTGNGATLDGAGDITNTGTITITNNKTIANTAALDIAGPVTVSTGTTTNNGTLCLGLSAGVCPSVTGDTLTVTSTFANAGTLSTSRAISVAGTFTKTGTVSTTDTATGIAGAGTFTNSTNSTLNIGGPLSVTTFTATASGNTVNYNGTGAQSVRATSYYNLSLSGARTAANNITLPNGGTVNIAGAFSPTATFGTGNYVITGNTINFNGSGAQTVPAFNYNNLTISGARTASVTLANGGTIGVAATFSPTATFSSGGWAVTANTVNFNGTGAQTIPAFDYNNLTISGARTVNSVTLVNGGTVGILGTFTPSATFTSGGYVVTNNTVEYKGASAQTLAPFTYAGLKINNASGVTLSGGNATATGVLTLTAGLLTTGSNSMITTGTCATSVSRPGGTPGHVVGFLQKAIPVGASSCTFEIGTSAAAYTPINTSYAGVTSTGNVLGSVAAGDHPNVAGSGVDGTKSVNRYWTLATPTTGALPVGGTYSATFNFLAGDVDAGAATGSFVVVRYFGGTWSATSTGARTGTSTQATALAAYGDFELGESAPSNFAREQQFIYTRELY